MCGTLAQLEHRSQIIIRVTYVLTYSTQVIVIVKLYASKSKLAWMYKNQNFSHYVLTITGTLCCICLGSCCFGLEGNHQNFDQSLLHKKV